MISVKHKIYSEPDKHYCITNNMHINFSLKRKFISFLRKWYEDDDIVSRELF